MSRRFVCKCSTLMALVVVSGGCSGAVQEDAARQEMTPSGQDMGQGGTEGDKGSQVPESMQDYSSLFINEVAAAGDPVDWFELINLGASDVELTGCTFSDDAATPNKGTIAAGTTIAAGARLVIEVSDEAVGFKLGGDEELHLHAPDGALIDSADWDEGESPAGGSFARLPDGTGDFIATASATRGEANVARSVEPVEAPCGNGVIDDGEACDGAPPQDGSCEAMGFASGSLGCSPGCEIDTQACVVARADVKINEVTSAGDDLIELYNAGGAAVSLEGWYVADANYPEDMESRHLFIEGVTLEAGEFLVLTKGVEHTFGVGKDDTITLYDAGGMVIDQVSIPQDAAEVSYCRSEDGAGAWEVCESATFGGAN